MLIVRQPPPPEEAPEPAPTNMPEPDDRPGTIEGDPHD